MTRSFKQQIQNMRAAVTYSYLNLSWACGIWTFCVCSWFLVLLSTYVDQSLWSFGFAYLHFGCVTVCFLVCSVFPFCVHAHPISPSTPALLCNMFVNLAFALSVFPPQPALYTCPVSVSSALPYPCCPPSQSTPSLPLSSHLFHIQLLVQLIFKSWFSVQPAQSAVSCIWCKTLKCYLHLNALNAPVK